MTSKNISITEDVYNKLLKIKNDNESFSELFLRLLKIYENILENSFGVWALSEEEKKEIWTQISTHNGRRWNKSNLEDFKATLRKRRESKRTLNEVKDLKI